jgi:hypothetical protein
VAKKFPKLSASQREELARLEKKAMEFELLLHQTRLLASALRREIRQSEKMLKTHGWLDPMRIEKIQHYSDTLARWVKQLRA